MSEECGLPQLPQLQDSQCLSIVGPIKLLHHPGADLKTGNLVIITPRAMLTAFWFFLVFIDHRGPEEIEIDCAVLSVVMSYLWSLLFTVNN